MNPDNAEYFNNHGYALMVAGRLPEAIAVLDSVIARYPRRDVAHGNLGEAHLLNGDTVRAIEHFEHYARLKPGKGGAYVRKLRELKQLRAEALRADSLLSLPIPAPAPAPPAAPPSRPYEPPAPRSSTYEPAPEPRREPPRRASPSTAFRDTVRLGGPRPSYVPPRSTAARDTVRLPERRR
jgi:tetratricopeptide (TPR) repeat protein